MAVIIGATIGATIVTAIRDIEIVTTGKLKAVE
jgi:hypothetical protein